MVYTPIFHFSAVLLPITFTYLAFPPIPCSLLMVLVLSLIPTFSSEKLSIFQMSLIPVVGSAFLIWRKSLFFLFYCIVFSDSEFTSSLSHVLGNLHVIFVR